MYRGLAGGEGRVGISGDYGVGARAHYICMPVTGSKRVLSPGFQTEIAAEMPAHPWFAAIMPRGYIIAS